MTAPRSTASEDRVSSVPARPRTRWWRWPAGLVLLAYVAAQVVEVALVRADGRAFLTLRDWWAAPAGRLTSAVVVVAALVHGLFGLAQVWAGAIGAPDRADDERTRAVVWFLVLVAAVPAVTFTVWPWLRTTM